MLNDDLCKKVFRKLPVEYAVEAQKILAREGFPDFVFGFDEEDEIKERIFSRITRKNGVIPKDL